VVIDESAMTGESDPVRKDPDTKPFMLSGCKVSEGCGEMVVTAVGMKTEWGRIMAVTSEENDEETPLQLRLDAVATSIGKVGTLVAVVVFIILMVRDTVAHPSDWYTALINSFIVAVTIIVVAVPEGLPLAVTLSLAYSMKIMMATDHALVRHLSACEGMGGATTICSDKTGTLTTNKMTVVRSWTAGVLSPAERPASAEDVPAPAMDLLIQSCFLNTTGAVSPPLEGAPPGSPPEVAGSPTEQALLRFAASMPGASFPRTRAVMPVLHMQPFSSAKKTMGVACLEPSKGGTRIFWKGASEIVLAACTRTLTPTGEVVPLSPDARSTLEATIDEFARAALRTLVLAYIELPPSEVLAADAELPWGELTLVSLVGIKDPCRPSVPASVAACQAAGIVVRMCTGDNIVTARASASLSSMPLHCADSDLAPPNLFQLPSSAASLTRRRTTLRWRAQSSASCPRRTLWRCCPGCACWRAARPRTSTRW
jgi:P-type Ca2+ transporter type 2C